jgi:hypothetical protein
VNSNLCRLANGHGVVQLFRPPQANIVVSRFPLAQKTLCPLSLLRWKERVVQAETRLRPLRSSDSRQWSRSLGL